MSSNLLTFALESGNLLAATAVVQMSGQKDLTDAQKSAFIKAAVNKKYPITNDLMRQLTDSAVIADLGSFLAEHEEWERLATSHAMFKPLAVAALPKLIAQGAVSRVEKIALECKVQLTHSDYNMLALACVSHKEFPSFISKGQKVSAEMMEKFLHAWLTDWPLSSGMNSSNPTEDIMPIVRFLPRQLTGTEVIDIVKMLEHRYPEAPYMCVIFEKLLQKCDNFTGVDYIITRAQHVPRSGLIWYAWANQYAASNEMRHKLRAEALQKNDVRTVCELSKALNIEIAEHEVLGMVMHDLNRGELSKAASVFEIVPTRATHARDVVMLFCVAAGDVKIYQQMIKLGGARVGKENRDAFVQKVIRAALLCGRSGLEQLEIIVPEILAGVSDEIRHEFLTISTLIGNSEFKSTLIMNGIVHSPVVVHG